MAQQGWDEVLLRRWFPADNTSVERLLTEEDICGIADILHRSSHESWSRIPRIYSVLRKIDRLDTIDAFVSSGVTDVSFPFTKTTLPEALSDHSARLRFLELQHLVYNTEALNLERGIHHGHFGDSAELPLKKIGELGKGGFGIVDRVVSTFSNRDYARKLIPRGRTFRRDKLVLQAFVKELSSLKRLSHQHLVSLVASYTDKKFVAIIMSPVADCNLETLLEQSNAGHPARPFLRSFFGCLTTALGYLHDNRIRHKDIKPSNVLIKHDQVYLTDFGTVLDWSELGHSTTATAPPTTPRYCAPEVMMYTERNSSSDVWSLGCVFVEMWTVVKQRDVEAMRAHMTSTGTQTKEYHANIQGFTSWIEILRLAPGPSIDNEPAKWISNMLLPTPGARWSVHTLEDSIREASMHPEASYDYMGLCCMDLDDASSETWSSTGSEGDDGALYETKSAATGSSVYGGVGVQQRSSADLPTHQEATRDESRDSLSKRPRQAFVEDEATALDRELPSSEPSGLDNGAEGRERPASRISKAEDVKGKTLRMSADMRDSFETIHNSQPESAGSTSAKASEKASRRQTKDTGRLLNAGVGGQQSSRSTRVNSNKSRDRELHRTRKSVYVDSESPSTDEEIADETDRQQKSSTTKQPKTTKYLWPAPTVTHPDTRTRPAKSTIECPYCGNMGAKWDESCSICRASRKPSSQANREFAPTSWGFTPQRKNPAPRIQIHKTDSDEERENLWSNTSAYVYDQRSARKNAPQDVDDFHEYRTARPAQQSNRKYDTYEAYPVGTANRDSSGTSRTRTYHYTPPTARPSKYDSYEATPKHTRTKPSRDTARRSPQRMYTEIPPRQRREQVSEQSDEGAPLSEEELARRYMLNAKAHAAGLSWPYPKSPPPAVRTREKADADAQAREKKKMKSRKYPAEEPVSRQWQAGLISGAIEAFRNRNKEKDR